MTYSRLNKFLSTLNFVLVFVGFLLVTSLFLPASTLDDSLVRLVTIPYRVVTLALALLVILLSFKGKFKSLYPASFLAFLLFWLILIVRIFYDTTLRQDILLDDTSLTWVYIFGICMPTIISLALSYRFIDLEKALWWILIISGFTFAIIVLKNNALFGVDAAIEGRHQGNAAVSTISFGHFGATSIILAGYMLFYRNTAFFTKLFLFVIILVGLFFVLRAGSRGPMLALVVVFLFLIFGRIRNLFVAFFVLGAGILALILIVDPALYVVGEISPLLEDRLRASIEKVGFGSRDIYYSSAVDLFLESPVWGSQYLIIFDDGSSDYSHNIFLDALISAGILGFLLLLYFLSIGLMKSNHMLKNRHSDAWLGLLLVQQITFNMFSGAFYLNPILSALLVIIFLKQKATPSFTPQ